MSSPTVRVSRSLSKDRDRRTARQPRRSRLVGTGQDRHGPCRDRCGPGPGSEHLGRSVPDGPGVPACGMDTLGVVDAL